MSNLLEVTIENGKYTVIQEASGAIKALRHGEEWRDLTGDKLVLALAQRIEKLTDALDGVESILVCAAISPKDHLPDICNTALERAQKGLADE